MRFQPYLSVGFAALTSALVLLSVDVSATGDTTLAGCIDGTVSDGHCDVLNNIDDCGRFECSTDAMPVRTAPLTLVHGTRGPEKRNMCSCPPSVD